MKPRSLPLATCSNSEARSRQGRLPASLPRSSRAGNIANVVLTGLVDSPSPDTAYTEVIQDGMLDLLDSARGCAWPAHAFIFEARGLPIP